MNATTMLRSLCLTALLLPAISQAAPCEKAASLAASALAEVNSFAWEMDKYPAPESITLGFPFFNPGVVGGDAKVTVSAPVKLADLENNGQKLQYKIDTYSATGNHIDAIEVVVDAYAKEDREFCSVKSVSDKR